MKIAGVWTATLDLSKMPSDQSLWNWTIDIEDKNGQSYVAGSYFRMIEQQNAPRGLPSKIEPGKSGYILSSRADYSSTDSVFSRGQNAFLKVWSDKVDNGSLSKAVWTILSENGNRTCIKLSGSNTEAIGRLLMSKFVLPFEIVSILLLAALIGAIVIARKDS